MKTVQRSAFLVFALVIPLLLAACNFPNPSAISPTQPPPGRTPDPVRSPDPTVSSSSTPGEQIPSTGRLETCIVGSWQLQEVQAILTSLLPPDIIEERVIRFQEIHGKILYTFRGDGTVQAVAQTVQATAAVDAGAIDVDLVVSLTGKGTAQYQVDGNPGSMRMHDPDVDQFNLSVSLGGVSILQDISIQDLVWFGMKNNESPALPYECRDSTLSLTVPPLHEGDPSATVILVRN